MEPSQSSCDFRRLRGKFKGQFAKSSVVNKIEKMQEARSKAKAQRLENMNTDSQEVSGSRLVDLDVLGNELWCKPCDIPLSLKNRTAERKSGLASIFTIRCQLCLRSHLVETQKKNEKDSTYEINSRLAFGMIDAGIGVTHVNTLLSALNTPTINHNTLKRYERIIGPAIEAVAKKSCIESIRSEKELTVRALNSEKNVHTAGPRSDSDSSEHASSNVSSVDNGNPPDLIMDLNSSCSESNLSQPGCDLDIHTSISEEPADRPYLTIPAALSYVSSGHEVDKGNLGRKRKMDRNLETNDSSDATPPKKCKIGAAFDAGWQKRSSGMAYNSKSGHGTAIGLHSGKILSYSVRTKDCRKCSLGHPKSDHDCRKNHTGSAKSMEAAMAVDLFTKNELFAQENVEIAVMVMDDDSSSTAAVNRVADGPIEKWSDFNHTYKKLTSALYKMNVSAKVREYLSKNFRIAVKKNKGNPSEVQASLKSVVPHAYGDHSLCGNWCRAKNSGQEYVYRHLPHGKCLNDGNRKRLTELFEGFASNSRKIAPCASTQGNESNNNVVASKNPKSRHYAGSESLFFRTAAAVCQTNIGCSYAIQVFQEAGFAPGKTTESFRHQKDETRKRKAERSRTIAFKKRRHELKKQRSSKDSAQCKTEGITYETGVSFHDVSELITNPDSTTISAKSISDLKTFKRVVIDIETTGLSVQDDQIFEIAASCDESSFDVYTLPSKPITKGASEATGFKMIRGELYYRDEKIETKSAKAAISDLIEYLKKFGCPVILIAHNGFRFDAPILLKLIVSVGLLKQFTDVVAGFVDSWAIFKLLLPERKKEKKGFSVSDLATEYLPEVDLASLHRASNDVAVLQKLIDEIGVSDDIILKNFRSIRQMFDEKEKKKISLENKGSLDDYKGTLSSYIINKMSRNGINKQILQTAFEKGGHDALRALLGQNINGKPLVTTNKDILGKLFSLFPVNKD
ncbi:hypothetical protein QAD02_013825 [Eretmocerus hayati]|uniref:Uncharacterized protein n=1 Tax=Eretmocerus hayati TaxID=131215 RepID=A0ACC2P3J3_9HYME|nr:hypothetical protein QAD02_013825 [Eretmocerus hayati]